MVFKSQTNDINSIIKKSEFDLLWNFIHFDWTWDC